MALTFKKIVEANTHLAIILKVWKQRERMRINLSQSRAWNERA